MVLKFIFRFLHGNKSTIYLSLFVLSIFKREYQKFGEETGRVRLDRRENDRVDRDARTERFSFK